MHTIRVKWEGPFSVEEVVKEKNRAGKAPEYDGEDYGLYQIYGHHILSKDNTLLYVGKAPRQTFSARMKQHNRWWLAEEKEIKIYLGKIYNPKRHSMKDRWKTWEEDIDTAEQILIYKYSPNYNSRAISNKPSCENVRLVHEGMRNRLDKTDNASKDL